MWVNCVVWKNAFFHVWEMKKSLMRYLFTWVFFFWQHYIVWYHMGLVVRKTVFGGGGGGGGCFDKECFKPVSSAKETSLKIEISPAASLHMILSKKQKKGRWSDCADAQAGLRLCCSQTPEDRVSRVEAHIIAVFMIRAIVNELHPTFFFFVLFF